MTIRRADDVILLLDICAVEDAEVLMQELETGASWLDWSGCTHLHTACLQVMMASHVPIRGNPAKPENARWVAPILHAGSTVSCQSEDAT
jgi:hypothetical protein